MGRRVGLAYNAKSEYVFQPGDPQDANAEFDHDDTIGVIEDAITAGGHTVVRIGNATALLEKLDRLDVDIVFNIAEGYTGRNRESQVPIILEMMGIPYVGSDGLTQGLTLDKVMTKKILIAEGIPTPRFVEVSDVSALPAPWLLGFPVIVKPRHEGSSKGLTEESVARDEAHLRRQTDWVIRTYHQPALIEEFIPGQEFTVAIIGNNPPQALPVVQIEIEGRLDLGDRFYTNARIRSGLEYRCPARIPESLARRITELALRTYRAVECRDFGRVDLRVNPAGEPFVLELNPLPSLSTEDVFMVVAKELGITYEAMIHRVLDAACARYPRLNQEVAVRPTPPASLSFAKRS
ncbi:MAG: ATP-grasp domain-containing protein [Candidatus Omnitrophica bacterium]|nr:ATP-grasp domain-containing protein [Candidatus Omnitrophota bacterium]